MEKGKKVCKCQNSNPPFSGHQVISLVTSSSRFDAMNDGSEEVKVVRHQWHQHISSWSRSTKWDLRWKNYTVLCNRMIVEWWIIINRHWRSNITISGNPCSFDACFITTNLTSEMFWTILRIKNGRKKYNKRACSWHPEYEATGQRVTADWPQWHRALLFLSFIILFPNFLFYFLFLPRWCVCVCVSFPSPVYSSLCLSYFILSSCLLSFFNSHSADAIGYYIVFLPSIPFSSKPVNFTLHLGGSVSFSEYSGLFLSLSVG